MHFDEISRHFESLPVRVALAIVARSTQRYSEISSLCVKTDKKVKDNIDAMVSYSMRVATEDDLKKVKRYSLTRAHSELNRLALRKSSAEESQNSASLDRWKSLHQAMEAAYRTASAAHETHSAFLESKSRGRLTDSLRQDLVKTLAEITSDAVLLAEECLMRHKHSSQLLFVEQITRSDIETATAVVEERKPATNSDFVIRKNAFGKLWKETAVLAAVLTATSVPSASVHAFHRRDQVVTESISGSPIEMARIAGPFDSMSQPASKGQQPRRKKDDARRAMATIKSRVADLQQARRDSDRRSDRALAVTFMAGVPAAFAGLFNEILMLPVFAVSLLVLLNASWRSSSQKNVGGHSS